MNQERGEEDRRQTSIIVPWFDDLPNDLMKSHVISKLSLLDYLKLKAARKEWSQDLAPIHGAQVWPLLITVRPAAEHPALGVLDVVSGKEYSIKLRNLDAGGGPKPLKPCFSKNGWVILTKENNQRVFVVHPFKGDAIALPWLANPYYLKGMSFSSSPTSPNFTVVAVCAVPGDKSVTVMAWRLGDEQWTELEFGINDDDFDEPFILACHNPVFFHGEFYCSSRDGRLGAFNPNGMTWRILDDPGLIPSGGGDGNGNAYIVNYAPIPISPCDEVYCFLAEWKGELAAIFKQEEAVAMFALDRGRMVWSRVEELADGVLFWDRKNALARPPPEKGVCNRVYFPAFREVDGAKVSLYSSLEDGDYYPSLYGVKEQLDSIWYEPNLDDFEQFPNV